MIRISDLTVKRPSRTIAQVDTFELSIGGRAVIIGENGSGKTTMLRVLAGLEKKFSGKVTTVFGSREIVYVHQDPMMFRGSVRQNVVYGLAARGVPKSQQEKIIQPWIRFLNLIPILDQSAQRLSGGEKKKVAIARALVTSPNLLLLDEPLAELDEETGPRLISQLEKLDQTTIVLSSPVWKPEFENFHRFDLQTPDQT